MLKPGVTAAICAIPDRKDLFLTEAIASVFVQTHPVEAVALSVDIEKVGAAANRDHALSMVQTEWVAFLDDDDWWYPEHIATLCHVANATGADLVHPHYDVIGGEDPFPMFEGRDFDLQDPHQIPVTFMVKTEAIRSVGGFTNAGIIRDDDPGQVDPTGVRSGEDWRVTLHLAEAGYKFAHTPLHTWAWRHHNSNTSGLPSRRNKS
jgi:glycosyltransferase involved in cell wall biosynthesis